MKIVLLSLISLLFIFHRSGAQLPDEKRAVLQVANQFFDALERQDTLLFNEILLSKTYYYFTSGEKDSVRVGARPHSNKRFKKDNIVKERMRSSGVNVQIHNRIATVWAPYDLWVNDKFSHCGVDVFTLLKGKTGWKIASIAFAIEKQGCN